MPRMSRARPQPVREPEKERDEQTDPNFNPAIIVPERDPNEPAPSLPQRDPDPDPDPEPEPERKEP